MNNIFRVRTSVGIVLALVALGSLLGGNAVAQGTVNFNNKVSLDSINAPIYDLTMGGALLDGTNFLAQLYSGPMGTAEDKLVPTGPIVTLRTGVAAGYVNVGANGSRTIPNVAAGESALLQIRAWTASSGSTYEDAMASLDPNGRAGVSPLVTVVTKPSLLQTPISMNGLQSFAIVSVVPEPSVQMLGAAGFALLAIRRWSGMKSAALEQSTPSTPVSNEKA